MFSTFRKIIYSTLIVLILSLFSITTSYAQDEMQNDVFSERSPYSEVGDTIVINREINDDVYLFGNNVVISSAINGDAFIFANSILIDAPINGDLRAVSEKLEIKAPVQKNVTFINTNTYISSTGEIGKDVYGLTSNFYHDGRIEGNLNLGFSPQSNITINGKIMGDLIIRDSRPIYGEKSYIEGDIEKLTLKENKDEGRLGQIFFKLLHSFILIILGFAFFKLAPKTFRKVNHKLIDQPFKNLALGLSLFLLTPIISVLLAISVIGIPVLTIFISLIVIMYFISPIFIGTLLGKKILNLKKTSLLAIIIGILVYDVITLIPGFGLLLNIFISLIVTGTILNLLIIKDKKTKKAN